LYPDLRRAAARSRGGGVVGCGSST